MKCNPVYFGTVVTLLATLAGVACAIAEEALPPMSMDTVRSIYEDERLADEQVVSSLAKELDRRITLGKRHGLSQTRTASDVAVLVRLIAFPHKQVAGKNHAASVAATLRSISRGELLIVNEADVPKMLRLAEALAGGNVPASELAGLLDDAAVPNELRPLVLQGLEKVGMPVSMLPRLITLLDDPTSYVAETEGVGSPDPKRVYPVRSAACSGLRSLGIGCKQTITRPQGQKGVGDQFFTLEENSLADQLALWIEGNDAQRSHEAVVAASQIKLRSVRALLVSLAENERLPEETRADIRRALLR